MQTACPEDAVNNGKDAARVSTVRLHLACKFYTSGWVCMCGLQGASVPTRLM